MNNRQTFNFWWLVIVPIALILLGLVFCFDNVGAIDEGKYDGPCTGLESVGRCADKRGYESAIDPLPIVPAPTSDPQPAEVPADIGGLK